MQSLHQFRLLTLVGGFLKAWPGQIGHMVLWDQQSLSLLTCGPSPPKAPMGAISPL